VTSTVAGLASLVSYPALLAVGLSAVEANVTNTSSLLFVAVGAALGSLGRVWRMRLGVQRHRGRRQRVKKRDKAGVTRI
jgi:hypothetical protein